MTRFRLTTLARAALAVLATSTVLASAAQAQSNDELLKELRALKDRVGELERKLEAAKPAGQPQWGMTPQQVQDFNRIAVKTEALEDAVEAQGLKGLKVSGYIDPVYLYNRRQNQAGFQFINGITDGGFNYDNSFFGMAWLDLQKGMEDGTKWRLTLVPNRGLGAGIDSPSIVHEATVSVPLGDLQTRFIAGQMPDWSGYEYLPSTQTKLITHNLLFDFTLPFTYTGAGMEYIRGKWDTKWMIANMNASKRNSGETAPVLAYRVDYSRGEFQGFGFAGVHGKATNFTENVLDDSGNVVAQPDSRVDLFEADAYFVRGDWTWQGQLSYGQQKNAAISVDPVTGALRDARWYGASTLLAYKFMPRWEAIGRLDYLNNRKNGGGLLGYTSADNRNGIGPGLAFDSETGSWSVADADRGVNRTALSLGMSWLYNLNTTFKAEARFDRASLPVFLDVKTGEYRKSNQVFGTSVVVSF